eukprot:tig00020807_g14063.t1
MVPGVGQGKPSAADHQEAADAPPANELEGGEWPGLDDLPDGILAQILELLGFYDAAKARGVSRTWRAIIDAVEWRAFDVVLDVPADYDLDVRNPRPLVCVMKDDPRTELLEALTKMLVSGRLRLAEGSAVFIGCAEFDRGGRLRAAQLAESTAAFIAALTSRGLRSLGMGGFRALTPYILTQPVLDPLECPPERAAPGRHRPDAVRELTVTPFPRPGPLEEYPFRPYLGDDILCAILRPFTALESIRSPHIDIDGPAAGALAATFPTLRRLQLGSRDESFLPRLAALRLEELELVVPPGPTLAAALAQLADGTPAAASLRSLRASARPAHPPAPPLAGLALSGARPSGRARPGRPREDAFPFTAFQLGALAGLQALETLDLTVLLVPDHRARGRDAAALGRAPRLRALRLSLSPAREDLVAGVAAALGEGGLPSLRRLDLALRIDQAGGAEGRAALLRAAGARLAALELRSSHGLEPEEARAGLRELAAGGYAGALLVRAAGELASAARAAVSAIPAADVAVADAGPPVTRRL